MEPEDTYDLFQRARAHMERGDNAQAMVALEKAKRREPDKASIREALGVAYLRMHRYREAADEFEHILAEAPANHYAHYCLGRCLTRLGDRSIAAGHYRMAAWLRPEVSYYQEAVEALDDPAPGPAGSVADDPEEGGGALGDVPPAGDA